MEGSGETNSMPLRSQLKEVEEVAKDQGQPYDCLETADQECICPRKQRAKEEGHISINTLIVDMAEDDGIFKKAPPILFGDGFAKRVKEWEEIIFYS